MTDNYATDFERLIQMNKAGMDDRTLAIISAAYADKYLTDLLAFNMPGLNSDLEQTLFDPMKGGPLSNFAAKIHVALALGATDEITYKAMKIIARIRNAFAHDMSITSCDDAAVQKLISKLPAPRLVTENPESLTEFADRYAGLSNRTKLEVSSIQTCIALHNALQLASHRKQPSNKFA